MQLISCGGETVTGRRESGPQPGGELAAEYFTQHFDWQEEVVARLDPVFAIRRDAAFGNDAVHVRMVLEFLVPRMQHAKEADRCAEVTWIASHL